MTRNGGEVESVERFEIGGSTQWALVRGRNSRSPVLLLVQAGPGFPIIHEARALEAALHLEDDFRVVYWDQRGSGKSFDAGAPKSPLRLDDLVGDLCALIHALCDRLAVFQVDVVGFSLGASLAAIAAARDPEPIRSVTAVGPDVNLGEAERFAYAFALTEAGRRSNRRALLALRAIGPPPHIDFTRSRKRLKSMCGGGPMARELRFPGPHARAAAADLAALLVARSRGCNSRHALHAGAPPHGSPRLGPVLPRAAHRGADRGVPGPTRRRRTA